MDGEDVGACRTHKATTWYIHPLTALEMVAIKKNEDPDYQEYYEFLKETIFNFLESNPELKEKYDFIEEFHG